MNGKGSRRRPEDADAIARRWPFRRKQTDKDVEDLLRWTNKAKGPTPTIYATKATIQRLKRKEGSAMGKCKKGGGKKK